MNERSVEDVGARSPEALQLADWRRQVAEVYSAVRAGAGAESAWREWRGARERLFLEHEQTPLPPGSRTRDHAPGYFEYDPAARVLGEVEPAAGAPVELPGSGSEAVRAVRCAVVRFTLGGAPCALDLFWIRDYAAGVFLSFRDTTSGAETYAAGRYLLDTAKGADLGMDGDRLVLDFNFAYQPSCSYDPRWNCPLAPRSNWLDIPVTAGERMRLRTSTG